MARSSMKSGRYLKHTVKSNTLGIERTFSIIMEINSPSLRNVFNELQDLLRCTLVGRMEVNYFRKHPEKQSSMGYVV